MKLNGTGYATYSSWDSSTQEPVFTSGSSPRVTDYTYDGGGSLTSKTDENGSGTSDDVTTSYYYNYSGLKPLTDETVVRGATTLFTQHYTLSADGQRTAVDETLTDGSTVHIDWTYDNLNRLVSEQRDEGSDSTQNGNDYTETYSYDANNNRTKKVHDAVGTGNDKTTAYNYNSNDEMTFEGPDANNDGVVDTGTSSKIYQYDLNGSLEFSGVYTGVNDYPNTHYIYDLRNRLVGYDTGYVTGGPWTPGNGDAIYGYDSDGNRIAKIVYGSSSSAITTYLIDSENPTGYAKAIEEHTGTASRSYVLGLDIIAQGDSTNGTQYLMKDGHGTTRALLNTSGNVISGQTYNFDAFYNPLPGNPSSPQTDWLAPDGRSDQETGDRYNMTRYVRDGQWHSMDSMIFGPGQFMNANLHVYLGGNPVNLLDPNGRLSLAEVTVAGGIIGALIAGIADYAATGQVHVSSVLKGAFLGTLLSPLAVAFPVFGFGLATYGAAQSFGLVWTVWTNPRSTNGQLAASLVVFGTSLFGVYAAGKNVSANGWYNPAFEGAPAQTAPGLSPSTPLSEMFDGVPDDAMVHASKASPAELNNGVKVSPGTNRSYWFRWGDIKHLTPTQLQTVIGGLAQSGEGDLSTFSFKLVDPSNPGPFQPGNVAAGTSIQEYSADTTVVPDAIGEVQPKNQ